jgi:deoxycytidylate deaminase
MPNVATFPNKKLTTANGAKHAETSQQVLNRTRSHELFIAVVGPAGAGVGTAAMALESFFKDALIGEEKFQPVIIKASESIREWANARGREVPPLESRKTLSGVIMMQDRGDEMRAELEDNAAVARAVLSKIRQLRADMSGKPLGEIDGRPRVYIIDSLRHPAEAHLLRRIYQDAFALVGVVCGAPQRAVRLKEQLFDKKDWSDLAVRNQIQEFMERDADAPDKHGQHVTDTFHEADFFVDNSGYTDEIRLTEMNEPINRFVSLMASSEILRPTIAETAMHHAHSAQLRSACLSRQVGAALVDKHGNVVATGTNEVPKAGGGVYGEAFSKNVPVDHRCAFRETKFCSSNKEQNEIILDLIKDFPDILNGTDKEKIIQRLRKTRLGGLIEFSRAVHAEMDAILSAARVGVSPQGTRLFVSTFPCHYCARHIVSAGIDEVQYIEPYPKSRALALHSDSITTSEKDWIPPSEVTAVKNDATTADKPKKIDAGKVLFRPFVGVAPRMYHHVFLKDRDYKDKITGDFRMGDPDWGGVSDVYSVPYTGLEELLATESP